MNPQQLRNWKDNVLVELLKATVKDPQLSAALIFKGARILNQHLDSQRQSLDIDSNLTVEFQQDHPDREERAIWFQSNLERAFHRYFEDQEPVRYVVDGVVVHNRPATALHRHGWDGLVAVIRIRDERMVGVRALPTLELEIAAPESLGEHALCELSLDGATIRAYSVQRIAGEKLRAFLTSLPSYRNKVSSTERTARAKDLFDLTRILDANPIANRKFWDQAAAEFRLACESRYVDCIGVSTFFEELEQTAQTYHSDPTLEGIAWENALAALTVIVESFENDDVFPLDNPLPTDASPPE